MHNYKLKGFFSWDIIDKDGSIVFSEPTANNLILTQGINSVASRSFVENILYCAVGSSNNAPLLSDTGLTNEVLRTNTVETAIANPCSTTLDGNVYYLSKTFKFPIITTSLNLKEIGWSWSGSNGNNLFSKALIVKNGVPSQITVSIGQYLRVKYTLQITINNSSSTSGNANITDWNAIGQYGIQLIGLRSITSDGSLSYYDSGNDCNEPSSNSGIFIGTNSTSLASFGSSANRSSGTNYTNISSNTYYGNGIMIKQASFGKGAAASSTLRSMGIGALINPETASGFVFVFDSNQTKNSDYILTLKFIYTWS